MEYILFNPDGKMVVTDNLTALCREHSLTYTSLHGVVSGLNKSHKGWTLDGKPPVKKTYILYDPNGAPHFITNMSKFCSERGLIYVSMVSLANGHIRSYRGWARTHAFHVPTYVLYNPEGVEHSFMNISKHCRTHGLNYQLTMALIKGRVKHHRGWTTTGEIIKKREFYLRDPNGQLFVVDNLNELCRNYDLNYQMMLRLTREDVDSHRGWTLQ